MLFSVRQPGAKKDFKSKPALALNLWLLKRSMVKSILNGPSLASATKNVLFINYSETDDLVLTKVPKTEAS